MQINKVSNISFGKMISDSGETIIRDLDTDKPVGLINNVIANDYNTPKLKARYAQLVREQESNPFNISLGLYLADKNEIPLYPESYVIEKSYQQATVNGKVFKQRIYNYQGGVMDFLEDACKYANRLNKSSKLKNSCKKFVNWCKKIILG